jgi:hypothetical protein
MLAGEGHLTCVMASSRRLCQTLMTAVCPRRAVHSGKSTGSRDQYMITYLFIDMYHLPTSYWPYNSCTSSFLPPVVA